MFIVQYKHSNHTQWHNGCDWYWMPEVAKTAARRQTQKDMCTTRVVAFPFPRLSDGELNIIETFEYVPPPAIDVAGLTKEIFG